KGEYRHFMHKEIFEQPRALADCIEGRMADKSSDEIFGSRASDSFDRTKRVLISACGTSFHAAQVAQLWIESLAGTPCHIEIASELRYRNIVLEPSTLFVSLSQSGETADTLAALREIKQKADICGTL